MENEAREVTYLSISLMIIALVISFISYGARITHKMADTRNKEIVANDTLEQYREFNGYNGKTLCGDDVIELIRMYYDDPEIKIFVNARYNATTDIYVGAKEYNNNTNWNKDIMYNVTCDICPQDLKEDHRYFDLDMFKEHNHNPDDPNNYFKLATKENKGGKRNDLRNWFPTENKYRAYLVYNSENPESYYYQIINGVTKGSGESDMISKMDSNAAKMAPDSKITGVVLISYAYLGLDKWH